MKLLHKLAAAAAATALVVTGLAAPTAQAAEPDVYTTPGGQIINGRLWNTTCAKYSSTVVRCTTDIWATQVVYTSGAYRKVTGWTFNNLTYLPSARSQWASNPLGKTGSWTAKDGRKWKTECDTAATGRGGCRSYAWATYGVASGSGFTGKSGWVFNNIVRFAEGSVKAVTKVPEHVLLQSRLTPDGLGPLTYGGGDRLKIFPQVLTNWERLGYVEKTADGECHAYDETPLLKQLGIGVTGDVADVSVTGAKITTANGAHAGMTIGQIKALYGSQFKIVRKQNYAEKQYFGSVRVGDRELQFRVRDGENYAPTRPLKDSDKVYEISAQGYTTDVSFGGC